MNITEKDIRSIVNARMYNGQMKKTLVWMGLTLAGVLLFSAMGLKALVLIALLTGSVALFVRMVRFTRKVKQAAAEMYEQAKAEGLKVE